MKYFLAVFRSRTQTLAFIDGMRSRGLSVRVQQTPREARVGCGISAAFRPSDIDSARRVIALKNLNGFSGFFVVSAEHGETVVRKF